MDIKNLLAYFVSSFNVKKFSYTTCAAWQWSVTLPRCEEVHITFKQKCNIWCERRSKIWNRSFYWRFGRDIHVLVKVVAYVIPENGMSYFKLPNQLHDICHFCYPHCRVLGFIVYSLWFSFILVEWKFFIILIFNEVLLFINKNKKNKK